jgi:hypothetical protein
MMTPVDEETLWTELHRPQSYWELIVTGGLISIALHLLIALAFVAAITATLRHASVLVDGADNCRSSGPLGDATRTL